MTTDIRCPHLGVSGGDVTLASWLVKEGDFAHQGQPIAELELEKSAIDLEAPISGRLVQLAVPEGAEGIHADDLLAVMAPEEESPALLDDEPVLKDEVVAEGGPAGVENETLSVGGKVPPDASVAVDPAGPHQARDIRSLESPSTGPTTVPRLPAPGSGSATATPLAHRMAAQAGIQLSAAGGTGGDGCITKADVERLIESATETVDPAAGRTAAEQDEHPGTRTRSQGVPLETDPVSAPQACEPIPLPRMRKVIAERMSLAKRTIPHFYLEISCATDTINSIRRQLNEQSGYCFTVNDFVIRAAALALVEAPELNVRWTESGLLPLPTVDVAVSVATPTGLITPVVRQADTKALPAISAEIRGLVHRAREGKLMPAEYSGGSLTVTNLGMYGVESMHAVINPPQSCILAVGAAEERPIARNGRVEVANMMSCALSCDHRVVDGVTAAEFLRAFKRLIENPAVLLI